jgi:hypothetical protein
MSKKTLKAPKHRHVRKSEPDSGTRPRKIYEVHLGLDLAFGGFVVVEQFSVVERPLCWAQSIGATMPYESDEQQQRDYANMLRHARRAQADPSVIGRSHVMIDYRQYGLPDSAERMPDVAYEWRICEPGEYGKAGKERRLFPFCRYRFEQMLVERSLILHACGRPLAFGEMDLNGKITAYPWIEEAHRIRTRQECTPETARAVIG